MEKLFVLLPTKDTESHFDAICYSTKFDFGRGLAYFDQIHTLSESPSPQKVIFLRQSSGSKPNKPIGRVKILPSNDKTILTFETETPNADFEEFAQLVKVYFQDLNLLEKSTKPEQPTPKFSLGEAREIVSRNLDFLDSRFYSVTSDNRELSTVYFIRKNGELLGKFRVSQEADGRVNYGPLTGSGAEWDLTYNWLKRKLQRADGTMTPELEKGYSGLEEYYKKQLSTQTMLEVTPYESGAAQLAKEMRIARGQKQLDASLRQYGLTIFPNSQQANTAKPEPPAKKNKAFEKRKLIGRTLSPWLKQLTIKPTIAACIAKIKEKPGYKNSKLNEKTMSKILDEYYANEYEK